MGDASKVAEMQAMSFWQQVAGSQSYTVMRAMPILPVRRIFVTILVFFGHSPIKGYSTMYAIRVNKNTTNQVQSRTQPVRSDSDLVGFLLGFAMKRIDISTKTHPNIFTCVDDKDYGYLMQWKWTGVKDRRSFYVVRGEVVVIDGKKKNTLLLMHRQIMEIHLGRRLRTTEIVHHIDGNTRNNKINNLMLTTHKAHMEMHNFAYRTNSQNKRVNALKAMPSAILVEADIPEIREMLRAGSKHTEIGTRFGVGRTAISDIKCGRSWTHVT